MDARILVVDDNVLFSEGVTRLLESKGYKTILANDGVEAIEKAFRELPDIILIDGMLPGMNGYQVSRLLKSDVETRNIPIIVLTEKDQSGYKYWGVKTGADAYLCRDFIQTSLLKIVEDLLKKQPGEVTDKPLLRKSGFVKAVDIVSKMNNLLDKKLFEVTVFNEMSALIELENEDFDGIVKVVMGTLARILDYDIAAIVIIQQYDVESIFEINHTVSEQYLKAVQDHTMSLIMANGAEAGSLGKVMVLNTDRITTEGAIVKSEIASFAVPVRNANKLNGLIVLSHHVSKKIDSKEVDFLKIVVKQAFVIIDNAWLYAKVKRLAITDSLTGIYNHGFLRESLFREYSRIERFKLPIILLLMDIDHFKRVNDTYGHLQGDEILRKVSLILRNSIRTYDILGRYGGEEFMVIMPEASLEDGIALAERIRAAIEKYEFHGVLESIKGPVRCTISIGVAGYPAPDIKKMDDLINKADKLLYRAKVEGRNRVCT
ncbi:MAG: diguanylate cyclase [Planctomycetes bacterium]|nr:diguanylate cyclase [Planctomycetota bacterium]